MIKIISEILEFDFFDQDVRIGKSTIKKLVKVPEPIGWVSKQLIEFRTRENDLTKLDLTGAFENTKVFGLYWKNFSDSELTLISSIFDLKISQAKNIEDENNLLANIDDENNLLTNIDDLNFQSAAELAVKKSLNRETVYAVIYYLSRPDKVFEGKLYVHGIWEITLPENLMSRLLC
jgi:hypothetical protein